jgi:hypothetical protein
MRERDSCGACRNGEAFAGAIAMVLQPIVDAYGQYAFAQKCTVNAVYSPEHRLRTTLFAARRAP